MKCPKCGSARIARVILYGDTCTDIKRCAQCLDCSYRGLEKEFEQRVSA
jgi:hypothetical protein